MPSTPEKILYEYAVVRYVPAIEREEFVNIGLVMMCKRRRYLRVAVEINEARIRAFAPDADIALLRAQLASFESIAAGHSRGDKPADGHTGGICAADREMCHSPIAELEVHERFRWLTAVRSAAITTSRPHPGLTADLDTTFGRLFSELVK